MPSHQHCSAAHVGLSRHAVVSPKVTTMKHPLISSLLVLPFAVQASEGLGLSLRVGVSTPTDSDTRDYSATTGYNAGLRFGLPIPGLLTSLIGTNSSIDLEGFQAKDGNDRLNYLGLTYNEQVRFASLGVVVPYVGLGVGAYRLGAKHASTYSIIGISSTTNYDDVHNRNGVRAGARAMVGVELPLGLFVEASAVVTGKVDGVRGNTANLAVGIRF